MNNSFDLLLTEALTEYSIKWMSGMPDDGGKWRDRVFSPSFERKMAGLIRKSKRRYKTVAMRTRQRAASATAAILITMLITVFSVKALREPAIDLMVTTYEKFSVIIFGDRENGKEKFPSELEQHYIPSFVPEGFTLTFTEELPPLYQLEYSDGEGGTIHYMQFSIKSSTLTVNTEGVTYEYIKIKGNTGIYFSNLGYQTVVWNDCRYGFNISGTVSKEEIIQIAESLEERMG